MVTVELSVLGQLNLLSRMEHNLRKKWLFKHKFYFEFYLKLINYVRMILAESHLLPVLLGHVHCQS